MSWLRKQKRSASFPSTFFLAAGQMCAVLPRRNSKRRPSWSFPLRRLQQRFGEGPPLDDDDDYNLPIWAGVLPLLVEAKTPIPDPRLSLEIPVPQYVVQPWNREKRVK